LTLISVLAIGCGSQPSETGGQPNPPSAKGQPNGEPNRPPEKPESGTPGDGGRTGSTGADGGLSQREWEKKLAAHWKAIREAGTIANELVAKRKGEAARKELDSFLAQTWNPGTTLAGWIGTVGGIRETAEKFPDPNGQPALTATLTLVDATTQWQEGETPSIQFINYDPDRKQSTGLDKEFESLRDGQVIRVWGRIHTRDQARVSHLVVTRIEIVDYLKERAELLGHSEKVLAKLKKVTDDLKSVYESPWSDVATGFSGSTTGQHCSMLAILYPEWKPAVNTFNRFSPPLARDELDRIGTTLTSNVDRLKQERFLDERIEADLKSFEEKLDGAQPEIDKVKKAVASILEMFNRSFEDPKREAAWANWQNGGQKEDQLAVPRGFPEIRFKR
jgi:hypothetical protein